MSKFRTCLAAVILALILPLWAAGAPAMGCPFPGSAPHQCGQATEMMSQGTCCGGPVSPNGDLERFVRCHCGHGPALPGVVDQARTAFSPPQWTVVGVADARVCEPAPAAILIANSSVSWSLSTPRVPFLLHCVFLI